MMKLSEAHQVPGCCPAKEEEERSYMMKLIVGWSVVLGLGTKLLRYERNKEGNLVPVDMFKGHPAIFYTFVVCVMMAFTGSSGALAIAAGPKLDKFRRLYSLSAHLFMASALGVLSFACLLDLLHQSNPSTGSG